MAGCKRTPVARRRARRGASIRYPARHLDPAVRHSASAIHRLPTNVPGGRVTSTSRPAALYDHGANNHPVPPPGAPGLVPGRLTEALADLHTVTQRVGTNVERALVG